jgi:hypothetical protein
MSANVNSGRLILIEKLISMLMLIINEGAYVGTGIGGLTGAIVGAGATGADVT